MQLKLSREERKQGLLFKKTNYLIRSQLVCSEEERMAIKKLDLEKLKAYTPYDFQGRMQQYSGVGGWADDGIIAPVENLIDAARIEDEIKASAKSVKETVQSFIDSGAESEMETTIDL